MISDDCQNTQTGEFSYDHGSSSFNIKENVEYQPVLDDNGIISFIPQHKNIFAQNPDYDLKAAIREMNLGDSGRLEGKENGWK